MFHYFLLIELLVSVGCGGSSSENGTIFSSDETVGSGSTGCKATVCTLADSICQVILYALGVQSHVHPCLKVYKSLYSLFLILDKYDSLLLKHFGMDFSIT